MQSAWTLLRFVVVKLSLKIPCNYAWIEMWLTFYCDEWHINTTIKDAYIGKQNNLTPKQYRLCFKGMPVAIMNIYGVADSQPNSSLNARSSDIPNNRPDHGGIKDSNQIEMRIPQWYLLTPSIWV